MTRFLRCHLAAAILFATACSEPVSIPTFATTNAGSHLALETVDVVHFRDWLANVAPRWPAPVSSAPLLVGAGDIAECYDPSRPPPLEDARASAATSPAAATAALLDRIPGIVIPLGDNAYEFGSPFDYLACYEPTWGRHRARTAPSAGNHEYLTPGAAGYFSYFPERSAPPLGYYSYDAVGWHVIVLNSTPQVYACYPPETETVLPRYWPVPQLGAEPTNETLGRLCAGDVAQQAWLIADLQANSAQRCTVAYFHHPRYSSGRHGNHYQMQRIWDILHAYGVDVVLSAHDHHYERFAPQDPNGVRDPAFGIRELLVGTGGADLRPVGNRIPNSEVVVDDRHGVLALGLGEGSYAWAFIATDGTVLDSGSDRCHGAPPPPRLLPADLPG